MHDAPRITKGARRLSEIMARQGLSHREVERKIGVNGSSGIVARWLSGDRRPGLDLAVAMQRTFGIPVSAWTDDAA